MYKCDGKLRIIDFGIGFTKDIEIHIEYVHVHLEGSTLANLATNIPL